ncbi:MAG: TolC family protein [Deltaproteobacteria bacterium]|nr:TolC family protein [Deltaproteobacteria bacterium]
MGPHKNWIALVVFLAPRFAPALSLDEAIERAEKEYPDVAAATAAIDAARARVPQAKAWQDPMFALRLYQVPTNFESFPVMWEIAQTIPFPGKLGARGRVAEASVDVATREREARALAVRQRVARAYFRVKAAERLAKVYREIDSLYAQTLRLVSSRLSVGPSNLADIPRIEADRAALKIDLLEFNASRRLALIEMAALLGLRDADAVPRLTTEPALRAVPTATRLVDSTLSRPDIATLSASINESRAEVAARKKEHLPDFMVSASYMANFGGMTDMWSVGVAVNVPLFYRSKQKRAVEEAEAIVRSRAKRLDTRMLEARLQLDQALERLRIAAAHVRLHTGTLVPLAERALHASRTAFAAGQGDLFAILDGVKQLVGHHRDRERYLAEFEARWADLEEAIGQRLRGKKIHHGDTESRSMEKEKRGGK